MHCEVRNRLIAELSAALRSFHCSLNRVIELDVQSVDFHRQRGRARASRDRCEACRAALLQHNQEHGCMEEADSLDEVLSLRVR